MSYRKCAEAGRQSFHAVTASSKNKEQNWSKIGAKLKQKMEQKMDVLLREGRKNEKRKQRRVLQDADRTFRKNTNINTQKNTAAVGDIMTSPPTDASSALFVFDTDWVLAEILDE